MTTVSVTDIKKKLGKLLAEDKDCEEIIIIENNRPVAIIQPIKPFPPKAEPAKEKVPA